ncbi:protein-disulfide isomerase [Allocatelliglobosispora scoriae]|uniref:Protein-disulfide isomerase n=1 Tax=Allocatelliglobosispora scoriae TaxID=643052 RepID=A0A841BM19_9ACTN|nr:thioredoxin domain-containing protein [Allocatelliglobosispora scoriae]MBB5870127.1 protein-disulfide isomerase [Allocatelliglobosispora scoriae]
MSKRVEQQRNAAKLIREQKAQEARRKRIVAISAVSALVLVIGGMIGYALYQSQKPITHATPAGANAAGTGIVVGNGPVTVEVYQDYLCPACKAFHDSADDTLEEMAKSDKIKLVTHPIAILDRLSTNQYSTRSAAASGCASDGGKFPEYSDVLYANQPAEGGAGHTNDQLITYGKGIGLGDAFAECVTSEKYETWPAFTTDESGSRGVNSTPSIFVNDKKVTPANGQSISDAVYAAIAAAGGPTVNPASS